MRWNDVDCYAIQGSDQSASQQSCVMWRLLKQNLLINALNKGFISITGPVFNMMEIKEENGQQKGGWVFSFCIVCFLSGPSSDCCCSKERKLKMLNALKHLYFHLFIRLPPTVLSDSTPTWFLIVSMCECVRLLSTLLGFSPTFSTFPFAEIGLVLVWRRSSSLLDYLHSQ